MSIQTESEGLSHMEERFGHDNLISLATIDGSRLAVRIVNSYYENGSFYTVTYALSNKMQQIKRTPSVAICGEWFTAHGIGENIGHPCEACNTALTAKLREVFAAWYTNGHTDEGDPNTCILRVRLTDGVLFHHGTKYEIDFNHVHKTHEPVISNTDVIKTSVDLMFYNLRIAMDTVDWNAGICGAPAWRYIYHTLHSADKWFINPSTRNNEPEPAFHTLGLDYPDNPSDTVLDRDTLYTYYEQVRQKVLDYLGSLNDSQLSECPNGCIGTRLGLALSQFRHMYAHIGILNGITIANTNRYPRVLNESTWRSGNLPELFDE